MANPMFEKLIAKKKAEGKKMSPAHEKAKSTVLGDLMDHLGSMGMDKINGMKKNPVSSGSTSKLDTKDLANHTQEGEDEHDPKMSDSGPNPDVTDSDEEYEGSPAEEAGYDQEDEASEESPDDKDAEIAKLKAELAKHKGMMGMGRI